MTYPKARPLTLPERAAAMTLYGWRRLTAAMLAFMGHGFGYPAHAAYRLGVPGMKRVAVADARVVLAAGWLADRAARDWDLAPVYAARRDRLREDRRRWRERAKRERLR